MCKAFRLKSRKDDQVKERGMGEGERKERRREGSREGGRKKAGEGGREEGACVHSPVGSGKLASRQGLADELLPWVLAPAQVGTSGKALLGRAVQEPVKDKEKAPKYCLERQTPHRDRREAQSCSFAGPGPASAGFPPRRPGSEGEGR